MRRLGGLVGSVALVLGLATAPPTQAEDAVRDNGAAGEADSLNQGDVPPSEACNSTPKASGGSRIVRHTPTGPVIDGTQRYTAGICVYLPPGYDDGTTRYPVLYLLHGGGGDQADWVTFGDVQATVDAAGGDLIVVMPDASNGDEDREGGNGVWYDHPKQLQMNETYLIEHVIPYVDWTFRTIHHREGRAIAGLSNGGLGAMVMAAKHPDLFVAATSQSGNLGGYLHEYDQQNRPLYHDGNTPTPLASNLALMVRWGATCDPMGDLQEDLCASWAFEQFFRYDNQLFHSTLDELGTEHVYAEVEGSHAWRWWSTWLRDHDLPFVLEHLADAHPVDDAPNATLEAVTWTYKSISNSFDVWGYTFDVDRDELDAWLEIDNTVRPMTVTGSGTVTVTNKQTGGVAVVHLGEGSTKPVVFDA